MFSFSNLKKASSGRRSALTWSGGTRWQPALQHSGPAIIDVVTDPNALSLPSHVVPEMAVGFGLALGKLVLGGHIDEVLDTIENNIRHTGAALESL